MDKIYVFLQTSRTIEALCAQWRIGAAIAAHLYQRLMKMVQVVAEGVRTHHMTHQRSQIDRLLHKMSFVTLRGNLAVEEFR